MTYQYQEPAPVRNWPSHPRVGWVGPCPVWPIPFASRFSVAQYGGHHFYDGTDAGTREMFWRESQFYWRRRREYEELDGRLPIIEGIWPPKA